MSDIQNISVEKALDLVGGSFETLTVDPSPLIRRPVQTKFLNEFFNVVPVYSEDDVYQKWKVTSPDLQLPIPKAFHEIVGNLDKKTGTKQNFNIGSFGQGWTVRPSDIKSRINPMTRQRYTIADWTADMSIQAANSWEALKSVQIYNLLTADVNYTNGNTSHTQYNYWTEFETGSRPAATSLQLATPGFDVEAAARAQVNLLSEDADKQGVPLTGNFTWLCGTSFFSQRREIEEAAGISRPLMYGPDLATNLQPHMQMGGFRHAYFDSRDGTRYIEVNDTYATGLKIGINDAYLVNESVPYFSFVFTKAQTMTGLESPVQAEYAWTKTDDRNGIVRIEESNYLAVSNYPKLIRKATV